MNGILQFIGLILIIFQLPKVRLWELRLHWNACGNEVMKPCYLITGKLPYILKNRRIGAEG